MQVLLHCYQADHLDEFLAKLSLLVELFLLLHQLLFFQFRAILLRLVLRINGARDRFFRWHLPSVVWFVDAAVPAGESRHTVT